MTLAIETSIDRLSAAIEGKQFEMRRSDGAEWMPMSADQLIGELAGSEHAAAIIVARLRADTGA